MSEEQFDALVTLIEQLAYRAAGDAINQQRAGNKQDDIDEARAILVEVP